MFHSNEPNGHIAIVLLDGFSTLSLGSVLEPFSELAELRPNMAPQPKLVGLDSRRVRSNAGAVVTCDLDGVDLCERLGCGRVPRSIVLCSHRTARPNASQLLVSLLHALVRHSVPIYAIGGVSWILAETGLLKSGPGTVHWSSCAAFAETHRELHTAETLFATSGSVTTCAGELATLDMVLQLIASISRTAASETADLLLVSNVRLGGATQPGSQSSRLRNVPAAVSRAVRKMSENIETPVRLTEIALDCGASLRSLQRLFRKHLSMTPAQYYVGLRLERAHQLLTQTDMDVIDVAVACGFKSGKHMSARFRRHYNTTPRLLREGNLAAGLVATAG